MSRLFIRSAHFLSLWMGVAIATFVLFHIVPSDPARVMLGANASEEQVAALRNELGLDKPLKTQFSNYISRALTLDLGNSFVDSRPVAPEIGTRLHISSALAAVALAFIFVYLIVSAVLAYRSKWSWLGKLLDFSFVSLPTLFASVIIALGSITYYPYTRFSGTLTELEDWLYLIPPAFVLALYPMGILGQIMRAQIHSIQHSPYVRTACALGLSEFTILYSYILRNALVPLLSALGNQLPMLLTSTFIVELVFSIPGIGALLLRSVLERDLPMLQAIILVTSAFIIALGYVLEMIYPLLDPRIRSGHER